MIFIHLMDEFHKALQDNDIRYFMKAHNLPRAVTKRLTAAMGALPVAVVMGARQTGKSTLVRALPGLEDYRYLTLDRADIREQAARDPYSLLRAAPRIILDEVQRDAELFRTPTSEWYDLVQASAPTCHRLTDSTSKTSS